MASEKTLRSLARELPGFVLAAIILLAAGAVAAVLVNLAGEILEAVGESDGVALWDRPVLDWAVQQRTPGLTGFMAWFTNTGGPIWQPIIMAAVALFLWWRWRDVTPLVLVVITELGALAISQSAKRVVNRARPPLADAVMPYETSASFPSGHTLQAFAAAAIVAYLLIRHLWDRPAWLRVVVGVLALAYATLMGFSRVFLGYHWLTDVMAAALLGIAWTAVVIACHRIWRARRHRQERIIEEEGKRPLIEDGGPGPTDQESRQPQ